MASLLVAARMRATGGRAESVGPGAPVLRTPRLDPTTHTPGRDGSARSPSAKVRGRPSRRGHVAAVAASSRPAWRRHLWRFILEFSSYEA